MNDKEKSLMEAVNALCNEVVTILHESGKPSSADYILKAKEAMVEVFMREEERLKKCSSCNGVYGRCSCD